MSSRKDEPDTAARRPRGIHLAELVIYWLAVIIVSLALVVGLVLLLESRDDSELKEARRDASLNAVLASEVWLTHGGELRARSARLGRASRVTAARRTSGRSPAAQAKPH